MKTKTIEILFVLNEEGMKIVLENNIFDINDIVPITYRRNTESFSLNQYFYTSTLFALLISNMILV